MLKAIFRFALIFTVTYLLLFLPDRGFKKMYGNFFRSTGTKLFTQVGDSGLVMFKPYGKEKTQTMIFITKASLRTQGGFHGEEYYLTQFLDGFLPTILFLSLVIATPLSWKRKFFALFVGFFLVTAYVMLKLHTFILFSFVQSAWIGLYQQPAVKASIETWNDRFVTQPTLDYTFVIIVWLALCVGKKELQKLKTFKFETIDKTE